MTRDGHDTSALLARAAGGDAAAAGELLARDRERLERMVRMRLDPRLRRRVDVDDVVQEVLVEATRRLPEYAADPAVPFVLWLRFLAAQKLAELHRRHVGAQARDVRREAHGDGGLPPADSGVLAEHLTGHLTSPSAAAAREELRERLRRALDAMAPADREVLVLRHFEQLGSAEVARELGLRAAAASKRYVRALRRLKEILGPLDATEA